MTDVLIKRELLERELLSVLDFSESNLRRVVDHLIDVGYTLATPRQPGGEGLEVVAWQDAENPLYTTAERRVLHDWANNGYPIVELCRLSDAQRPIAELTDRNTKLCATINRMVAEGVLICDERDTLRQQLAERDATIERLEAGIPRIQEQSHQTRQQRDKLAGLLREAIPDVEFSIGEGYKESAALFERIDAALAEVNK